MAWPKPLDPKLVIGKESGYEPAVYWFMPKSLVGASRDFISALPDPFYRVDSEAFACRHGKAKVSLSSGTKKWYAGVWDKTTIWFAVEVYEWEDISANKVGLSYKDHGKLMLDAIEYIEKYAGPDGTPSSEPVFIKLPKSMKGKIVMVPFGDQIEMLETMEGPIGADAEPPPTKAEDKDYNVYKDSSGFKIKHHKQASNPGDKYWDGDEMAPIDQQHWGMGPNIQSIPKTKKTKKELADSIGTQEIIKEVQYPKTLLEPMLNKDWLPAGLPEAPGLKLMVEKDIMTLSFMIAMKDIAHPGHSVWDSIPHADSCDHDKLSAFIGDLYDKLKDKIAKDQPYSAMSDKATKNYAKKVKLPLSEDDMALAKKLYPDCEQEAGYFSSPGDYTPMVEHFGKVLVWKDIGKYQGDHVIALHRKYQGHSQWGYLVIGYGSCSGCDALQACGSYAALQKIIEDVGKDIKWFGTLLALQAYVQSAEVQTHWETHTPEFTDFVATVCSLTEASGEDFEL